MPGFKLSSNQGVISKAFFGDLVIVVDALAMFSSTVFTVQSPFALD